VIIRPLTPDFPWDVYDDLVTRAFGPGVKVAPEFRGQGAVKAAGIRRPGTYADRDRYAYLTQDGFLAYHWRRGHEEIFVDRLVASTAAATAALWALAASNSSVAETVRALVGPSDPLWWMLREQDANIAERQSWMLRLLDAPAAIAARGFPATDLAVPLQITDDLRPANSGRRELTVRAGTGRLSPCRTGDVPAPAHPASLAATAYMLDDF
jgi:predicted acetyltransferase